MAAPTVEAEVEATVGADLDSVQFRVAYAWTPTVSQSTVALVRPADAYWVTPPLPPAVEPQLFPFGLSVGGFERLAVTVDGGRCRRVKAAASATDGRTATEGRTATVSKALVPVTRCRGTFSAGRTIRLQVEGTLRVPERYGPFGVFRGQLTLLGGWFPVVGPAPGAVVPPPTRTTARVRVPAGYATVLGRTYRPHVPGRPEPTWRVTVAGNSVPLIVLPARTGRRVLDGGRIQWISGRRTTDAEPVRRQARATMEMARDVLALLRADRLPAPTRDQPLLLVEAPLRRNLALAAPGLVLVSDRAFRLPPLARFFRFHRYPLARATFAAWAFDHVRADGFRTVAADAVGAFLRDRFVVRDTGYAEDLFDILSFWSFLPAVDALLYQPQAAFLGAYFRVADESDPYRVNLVDPPSTYAQGRIVYEKLKDRRGPMAAGRVMRSLVDGRALPAAVNGLLGRQAGQDFLRTWLGPYPRMQYALERWSSTPIQGPACRPADFCHRVEVDIRHRGQPAAEPVQLRLTDEGGGERLVWSQTSTAALRTVTATLAEPLDLVELDPWGRVSETPTVDIPSPKLDNRSRAKWRVLLNSFNFATSPTAGTLDTAIDIGLSRVRDVRWRYGATASFGPESVSLSARTLWRFGRRVTPDRLAQWVGASVSGDWLRSEFADQATGNFAMGGTLFYGYDDRQTVWAPEAGRGLRAVLGVNHVFGTLSTVDPDGPPVTRDSLFATVRGLRSWRVDARHQFSVRGSVGAFLAGRPQPQLLFFLGGREAVRGYVVDEEVGRYRALASAEWVHGLLGDEPTNVFELVWTTRLDGALFADVAAIGDALDGPLGRRMRADVGYGFRIYLDYLGVRPGVMAIDVAVPLLDLEGRLNVGPPAVYIDFSQSFLTF